MRNTRIPSTGRAALSVAVACALLSASARAAGPARIEDPQTEVLKKIGIDQKLNGQVPLDLEFRDEEGNTVRLGDYFGNKPVILSLVYFECPMLCTLVLNGLEKGISQLKFDVGDEFEVVTVSFDPRETPKLAARKKASYLEQYNRPGAEKGWHFLTGDAESIRRLTESVGFRYAWDDRTQQFAHASGIMILTPSGKLARYFYGVDYAPRDLQFGLMEAAQERIGSKVDQLLLLCYHYDPLTGRYGLAIMGIIRIAGAVTVLAIALFIVKSFRREKRATAIPKPA